MAENDRLAVADTTEKSSTSASNTDQPGDDSSRTEHREEVEAEESDGVETTKQRRPEAGEEKGEDGSEEKREVEETGEVNTEEAPPLPDEEVPPLPDEAPPGQEEQQGDDGWEPVWDANAQAYYFYNRITGVSQWENPRVPDAASVSAPRAQKVEEQVIRGGYNPAIHGDYDPTAPYAQQYEADLQLASAVNAADQSQSYTATGAFNRFTGRWQDSSLTPENFNDENKSRRQMNAYFDVDAAANSHNGRSLKAERSHKKLTKAEVKAFREKRRERKEEKRRAWLRD
ncbi:WW domain protein [Talaromyces stipitatus ATCC 10500]|uniref:WW domain protein n=1 Tax=Talaromyces stipitatus (strain ATCC 10500 / CBS 375.48 / QM 6759 / NRRL 1006) TaxID=441959 RepID=B8M9N0_TALSN|nr:WW domain protein [Talaromyces stipitatus ATCC 10500]EED18032.1 WW domain protein [Talaromyces stipitatus ATCC 10500]